MLHIPTLSKGMFLVYLTLTSSFLQVATLKAQSVIISQYIEASSGSDPKGIEIFNVSTGPIDFSVSSLIIQKGANGSACSTVATITSGILAVDEVWVVGTAGLTTYAQANASGLSGWTTFADNSNPVNFNGDDAIFVYLGSIMQDMFGDCGSDPGSAWTGGGVSTENNNLELIANQCIGNTAGWTDPSSRFNQITDVLQPMLGFGTAPASCNGPCSITPNLTNIECSKNGTPSDSSDDYITFSLEPSITVSSMNYTLTGSGVTFSVVSGSNQYEYNNLTIYRTIGFIPGTGDFVVTVTDVTTPSCNTDITLTDPGVCPCGKESFTNIIPDGSPTTYSLRTWTGDNEDWTSSYSIVNQTLSGPAITIKESGILSNDTPIAGGIGLLEFDYKRYGSGNATLQVWVNGIQRSSIDVSSTTSSTHSVVVNSDLAVELELRVVAPSVGKRVTIDNLSWSCFDLEYPYWQSKANGNWSSFNTWQVSADNSSWSDSDVSIGYPEKNNALEITILDGHTVTVNDTYDVPTVVIEDTGILQTVATESLHFINSRTGPELLIKGTWIDNGSGNNIEFHHGATWKYGEKIVPDEYGTIIKTRNSSVTNYKTTYEGANPINDMPANANWIYRHTGNEVAISVVNIVYPNLTIESTNSDHDFNGTTETLNGGSNTSIIKGDLTIGTPGNNSTYVKVRNYNVNSSPITIQGNLIIADASILQNTEASGTNNPGTGFEVQGDIDIKGTGQLILTGGGSGFGVLKLSGDSIQSITGSVTNANAEIQVNQLEVDKNMNEVGLYDVQVDVQDSLVLTKGRLNFVNDLDQPTDPNLIHLTDTAKTDSGSLASFVNGKIRKTGFNANSEFIFPVGDKVDSDYYYQPASIEITATTGYYFDVEFFWQNWNIADNYLSYDDPNWFYSPPIRNPSISCLETVSTCNYWMIDREVDGPNAKLGLSWNEGYNCVDIVDPDILRIGHFDSSNDDWDDAIPSSPCSDDYTSYTGASPYTMGWIKSDVAVTAFSPFTLAQEYGPDLNVLPIHLLSFSAAPKDNHVLTQWTTASEIDNDYFTVERSLNATDFEAVGYVPGAGNSNVQRDYMFEDPSPYRGLSYYRLKQTDFNGDFSHSQIVAVEFGIDSEFDIITAYSQGELMTVEYHATAAQLDLKVFDLLGQVVHQQLILDQNGRTHIDAYLPSGAYLIVLSDGVRQVQRKVFW